MTQNGHTFVAVIILLIFYQTVFHLFLKHRDSAKKNMQELSDIFDEYF